MEFASVRTSVSSVAGPLVQFTSEGQQPSVSEPGGNHSRRVSGTASLMPEMPEGEPLGEALSRQSTRSSDPFPVSSPESNRLSTDTDRYPVESGEVSPALSAVAGNRAPVDTVAGKAVQELLEQPARTSAQGQSIRDRPPSLRT
jgi:hypothetical protein